MKMKTSIKIASLAALALSMGLTSCNDFLDKLPDNRMELKSADDLSKLLVNAYPTATPAYVLEMYSDNTDQYDRSGWSEMERLQEQAYLWQDITEIGNETPQDLWDAHYRAIAAANEVIKYVREHDNDPQYDPQMGEALLCRAYSMMELSRVFCMAYHSGTADQYLGLPYPEEPETVIGTKHERGTLAELYKRIDDDITEGLKKVQNNYTQPKYHFTQAAANALAARFYLYYEKYDKAIECSNAVLGQGTAAAGKLRDWAYFGTLSQNQQVRPEAYASSKENANLLITPVNSQWGVIAGPYSMGDKYAHGMFLANTETLKADQPWGSNTSTSSYHWGVWNNSSLAMVFLRKIGYEFEYTDIQAGIGYAHAIMVPFNTDDALLTRAEAYALSGNYEAAVQDLNTEVKAIRKTAPKTLTVESIKQYYAGIADYAPEAPTTKKPLNTPLVTDKETQEPVLQAVLNLRRLVCIHEGQRLQDVKRYGITIYRRVIDGTNQKFKNTTDVMQANDPRLAIQIPQDVITAGLPANPR